MAQRVSVFDLVNEKRRKRQAQTISRVQGQGARYNVGSGAARRSIPLARSTGFFGGGRGGGSGRSASAGFGGLTSLFQGAPVIHTDRSASFSAPPPPSAPVSSLPAKMQGNTDVTKSPGFEGIFNTEFGGDPRYIPEGLGNYKFDFPDKNQTVISVGKANPRSQPIRQIYSHGGVQK